MEDLDIRNSHRSFAKLEACNFHKQPSTDLQNFEKFKKISTCEDDETISAK